MSYIVGQSGTFGQTNYAAAKAKLIGFTKSLALETARSGITGNAICPGYIATEMVKAMQEDVLATVAGKIPMQRLGTQTEMAEAVVFICNTPCMKGQCISLNGGLCL